MKYRLFIVLFLFIAPLCLHTQTIYTGTLDDFKRELPLYGFNGNTIRGPTWSDSNFTNKVASTNLQVLRYPGGEVSNFWDWEKGWFVPGHADLPQKWIKIRPLQIRFDELKNLCDITDVEIIYVLNMYSSTLEKQLEGIKYARNLGINIKYIELGNEFNTREHPSQKDMFRTAHDYAQTCNEWIAAIKKEFPDIKISVVGGNSPKVERSKNWNQVMMDEVTGNDAISLHLYLFDPGKNTTKLSKFFINAYNLVLKGYYIQNVADFNNNIDIWITEFNLWEIQGPKKYTDTWTHSLLIAMLNSMTIELNKNVKISCLHNITSFFGAIDNTKKDYPLTASGVAMNIWMRAIKNTQYAQRIKFNPSSKFVINEREYPKFIGWKFYSENAEKAILINFTNDNIQIKLDNVFTDGNIYYIQYFADEKQKISGLTSVQNTKGTCTDIIPVGPLSITVLSGNNILSE